MPGANTPPPTVGGGPYSETESEGKVTDEERDLLLIMLESLDRRLTSLERMESKHEWAGKAG